MTKNNRYNILIHFLFGAAFLSFPFLGSPDFPFIDRILHNPMGRTEVFSQIILLLYFYVNFFVLVPQLFFKKKYALFSMYSVAFLLLVLLLIPIFFKFPEHIEGMHHFKKEIHNHADNHPVGHRHHGFGFFSNPGMVIQVSRNIYLFAFVFALVLLIKIAQKWRRFEKEKMSTELNYLKAQINPHFLFNTLNSVYSLSIEERAVNTSAAIVKLSGMMRYVTSEALAEKVSLEKELDYINSYIELQKIRFGDTVKLSVDLVKINKPHSIAPLILISFIENAFKYGVNPEENSEINISIYLKNTTLQLFVKNKKVKMIDQEVIGSGIGIQNTKNRLDLLYSGKYNLLIDDKEGFYSVNLEINLA